MHFQVRLLHKVCTIKAVNSDAFNRKWSKEHNSLYIWNSWASKFIHLEVHHFDFLWPPYVHQSQILIFTIPELQFLLNWHSSVCNGMFWMRANNKEVADMHHIQWVLIVWVLMRQSKGLFWYFRETYYLPPFSEWQPGLGACYCNMEEGMDYTARLGGFWPIRVTEREKRWGLYQGTSHIYPQLPRWVPYTHIKITIVTKTFTKRTQSTLSLFVQSKFLMFVFPRLKSKGNLLAHASKYHLQKFQQSLHWCILTN
jgi:hypothetical protein